MSRKTSGQTYYISMKFVIHLAICMPTLAHRLLGLRSLSTENFPVHSFSVRSYRLHISMIKLYQGNYAIYDRNKAGADGNHARRKMPLSSRSLWMASGVQVVAAAPVTFNSCRGGKTLDEKTQFHKRPAPPTSPWSKARNSSNGLWVWERVFIPSADQIFEDYLDNLHCGRLTLTLPDGSTHFWWGQGWTSCRSAIHTEPALELLHDGKCSVRHLWMVRPRQSCHN